MEGLPSVNYLLIILAFILLVVHGKDLTTFLGGVDNFRKPQQGEVEDNCGFSTGRNKAAGILKLDAEKLVRGRGYRTECKVTVEPSSLRGSHGNGRVLFYFTKFELPGNCSDFNVTLLDGSSSYARHVTGAPHAFCFHNKTLIEPNTVFNTSTDEFSVLVRWKSSFLSPYGGFELKCASYYEGKCDSSEDVIECANTRCTASEYHCHTDIYTCGTDEKKGCDLKELEEVAGFLVNILKSVRTWIIVIAVVIGLIVIRQLYTCLKHRSIAREVPRSITSQRIERVRVPSINRVELSQQYIHADHPEPGGVESIELTVVADDTSLSSLESSDQTYPWTLPSNQEVLPVSLISPQLLPTATPSEPPPSYDEYMSKAIV